MKIAVDAMGGDYAPDIIIEGALKALSEIKDVEIILVGDKHQIEKMLPKSYDRITIYHASQVVNMEDSSTVSVRSKKDSSVNVAVNLVKQKHADALITAGHTGAAVCSTTLNLGLLPGIKRAGIATVLPTLKGYSLLIDVGANIDPRPSHLLQYAIMGEVYSKYILKKEKVKIGLLNIGEEESKGTDFLKSCHKLLESSQLDFVGNLEGADIFNGICDVIVCDGFAGNITLKVTEGFADAITILVKKYLGENIISRLGGLLSRNAFKKLYKEIDPAEYGGALLLGVKGICIISHGASKTKAIKNAIRVASESVKYDINKHILEKLELES